MKRTLNIADKLQWNLIPYAVDFKQSKTFSWKPSINFLNMATIKGEIFWSGLITYLINI